MRLFKRKKRALFLIIAIIGVCVVPLFLILNGPAYDFEEEFDGDKGIPTAEDESYEDDGVDEMESSEAEDSAVAEEADAGAGDDAEMASLADGASSVEVATAQAPVATDTQMSALDLAKNADVSRQVHYDADVTLEAKDPNGTIEKIVEAVEKVGGYVERRTLTRATLKVPVKQFFPIYFKIVKSGKVITKRLEARDVTDAYNDLKLRRKILESTLGKFQALLKRAKSTSQRLALVEEIKKLKRKIAALDESLAYLSELAQFSKIVLQVRPSRDRLTAIVADKGTVFDWIRELNPGVLSADVDGQRLVCKPPAQFVELLDHDLWFAETPTKTRIRARRLPNDPRGSTGFWVKAIEHHFKNDKRYKLEAVDAGGFRGFVLTDKDVDAAPKYLLALNAGSKKINVVEVLYPKPDDFARFHGNVVKTFKEGMVIKNAH